MTTTTTTQYAIFGETWIRGGEMISDGMVDGPMSEIESRGDLDAWEARLAKLREHYAGRRFSDGPNGVVKIIRNLRLGKREVTITVTDWEVPE